MGFTAMGPKEVFGLVQPVLGSIQYVTNLIRENRRLRGELEIGLDFIKRELQMIQGDIEKYEELQLQELACDIEDFVYLLWEPRQFGGFILNALGTDPRPEQLGRITHFKDSIKSLLEKTRQQKSSESSQSGAGTKGDRAPPDYTREDHLVGISKPKRELLELLMAADGWQPEQLRVISIVGPLGVGKTALARAVHDDPVVAHEFDCVAWVVASECNHAEDLLNKIHQDVVARTAEPGGTTSGNLHDILKDNRYLVFIDDLQWTKLWEDIEHAFPRNDRSSRIIVTTSVHSVANACSSRRGRYVYAMGGLGDVDSKKLFWTKVNGYQTEPAPSLDDGSKSIFIKCGGLPLALISAADYLRTELQNPSKALCERVGEALGDYLSGNEIAFEEMKRALVQCYDSLPDNGHQTCLLSLSIFPRGHQINSKSLIRRLLAEGLIDGDVVRNCLEKLIDRSIIEPVQIRNNSKVVERCQVHSIMLEFTIHKSVSKNFVTLIHSNKPQYNKKSRTVRRLTVQSSAKVWCDEFVNDPAMENGLSAVRSLTIFNSELLDFKKCKLLRVLDLEGCNGLKKVLDDKCEFLFLKYLSLRGSDVPRIPKIIGKLYNLETLDLRERWVEILPMEVIMLPNLVYLFGQFELPLPHKPRETRELENFLSEKSKLHTLAGFVTNKTQDFENIILHARRLRKVKVWCNDTATPAPHSTPAAAPPAPAPSINPAPDPAPRSKKSIKQKVVSYIRGSHKKIKSLVNCTKLLGPPGSNPSTLNPPQREGKINSLGENLHEAPLDATEGRYGRPSPLPRPSAEDLFPRDGGHDFSEQHVAMTRELTVSFVSSLEKRFTDLESLSIDSSGLCKAFLSSLKTPCAIKSIKLRGELESLPPSTTLGELRNLNKLHLLSTGLRSEDLSVLQSLPCLEYLKLAEDGNQFGDGSEFVVKSGGFPSLQQLWFELPKLPRVQIEQGAMTNLTSLQLLCQEFADVLGVTDDIVHLESLNEVVLYPSVGESDLKAWERAANQHQNRPHVKKQPTA